MKLEPLPGAPGYMVDTDAMAAYSYKRGTLRRIKTKTIYRACNISVDGKVVGTTIYRMVYCVQRGIDITKIPKGVCIGVNQYGSITVVTRSEISEKASRTVEARRSERTTVLSTASIGETTNLCSIMSEKRRRR